jgi:hypothetical protein
LESDYGGRNPPPDCVEHIRGNLCVNALFAIKNGDAFGPWKAPWVQAMLVSAAAFDKVLFPADRRQRPGPKPRFSDWFSERYPSGAPSGYTHKELAMKAKDSVGRIVDSRTVSRAIKKLRADKTN